MQLSRMSKDKLIPYCTWLVNKHKVCLLLTFISRHSFHFPPHSSPTHFAPSMYPLPLCLQCDASCGNGEQFRNVSCIIPATNSTPQMTVDDSQCDMEDRPTNSQPCNLGQCPYTWRITRYGAVRDMIVCPVQWGNALLSANLSVCLLFCGLKLVDSLGKMSCFLVCGIFTLSLHLCF